MSRWKIFRRDRSSNSDPVVPTGEVYDDVAARDDAPRLPVADYLALRSAEDGWDYSAEPL